jgi:hypothetical protein
MLSDARKLCVSRPDFVTRSPTYVEVRNKTQKLPLTLHATNVRSRQGSRP